MQFDHSTGTLTLPDGEVHLMPAQADFLEALRRCNGRLARYEYLRDSIWTHPPKGWLNQLSIHAVKLRKFLEIENEKAEGFVLLSEVEPVETQTIECDIDLELSPTEGRIFNVLLKRSGRIASAEDIILEVWSDEPDSAESMVKLYIHRLRKKLKSRGWGIKTIYKRGYMLVAL